MFFLRQEEDHLEIVHEILGPVAVKKTLYEAQWYIHNWPASFFEDADKKFNAAVDGSVILLVDEVNELPLPVDSGLGSPKADG